MRILVVEDDVTLATGLIEGLAREGFQVDHLDSAEPAEGALGLTAYDLAIVDIGLPGMDGLELIRRVRRHGLLTPILILTARDGLDDRVQGLDIGADDYLLKPFLLPELLARLRALVRRSRAAASLSLRVGDLALDVHAHSAMLGTEALELTGREWSILEQLALALPRVVAKQKLADSLRGQGDHPQCGRNLRLAPARQAGRQPREHTHRARHRLPARGGGRRWPRSVRCPPFAVACCC